MIIRGLWSAYLGLAVQDFGFCGFGSSGFTFWGLGFQGLYCNHKSLGLGLGSATLASVKQLKISDLLDPEPATSDLLALDPKPNPTIGP